MATSIITGILSNGDVVIRGDDDKYRPLAPKTPNKRRAGRETSRRWQPIYREQHRMFCDSQWGAPPRLIGFELRREGFGNIPPPPVGFLRDEYSVDLVAGSNSRWRTMDRSKKPNHHLRMILAADGIFNRDLDRLIAETCEHHDNPSHAIYCRWCGKHLA